MRPAVAVCGAARVTEPAVIAQAEEVGAALARAGANLLCGGGGGVMEAASRGFDRARKGGAPGGTIVAILPGRDRTDHRGVADVVLPTGIGYARNVLLTLAADAVIVVAGGAGTLSEIALAWQHGKPVIALASSGGFAAEMAGRRLDSTRSDAVEAAATAGDAVARALAAAGRGG